MAGFIIAQMMVNVGIGMYFHINKIYIASQLCINKNNPALHCNGHCYLTLQLKKAAQREKQSAQIFKGQDQLISNSAFDKNFCYFISYTVVRFSVYPSTVPGSDNYYPLIKPPSTHSFIS